MRTVIIQTNIVKEVSGLHTWELSLMRNFYNACKFIYVYDAVESQEVLSEMAQYAQTVKNEGQVLRGDLLLISSLFCEESNIQTKRVAQVYHSITSQYGLKPSADANMIHIAVSNAVAKDLKESFDVESIVLENLLTPPKTDKVLRLLTASRIAHGKGFERMTILAQEMKKHKIKFVWEVYGKGSKTYESKVKELFKDIPEVAFLGTRRDIRSYMYGIDYVVQLSDSEGFCYSVYEALQVSTPVIVTDWEGVRDVVLEDYAGYILDMDMSNLDVEKIYQEIPSYVTLGKKVNKSLPKWKNFILFN